MHSPQRPVPTSRGHIKTREAESPERPGTCFPSGTGCGRNPVRATFKPWAKSWVFRGLLVFAGESSARVS